MAYNELGIIDRYLDSRVVESRAESARQRGVSRARVTQDARRLRSPRDDNA